MFLKVIDNFLTKSYFEELTDILTSGDFEWGYTNPGKGHMGNLFNGYGFTHAFADWQWPGLRSGDRFLNFIQPLLYQTLDATDCDYILRARADMVTWQGKEEFVHPPHVDYPFSHTAAVYYINESDGDTVFYNVYPKDVPKGTHYTELKEYSRSSPKPNRLIIFDGELVHTGSSPTKHQNRVLINSDYIKKENIYESSNGPLDLESKFLVGGKPKGYKIILSDQDQVNHDAMGELYNHWHPDSITATY